MRQPFPRRLRRREFVRTVIGGSAAAGLALAVGRSSAAEKDAVLEVGQGIVDITPPLGLEMAGFHRAPGNERRITGIRQAAEVRALVIRHGPTEAAIVSLDVPTVSRDMAQRVAKQIAAKFGIAEANVRLCATHTHSMPSFCFLLQWGAVSPEYMATVEQRIIQAVELAKADLAPAELHLGKSRAVGGNFNRTTKDFKTDEHFGKDSTDDGRWLDTMVHVLRFVRGGVKPDLVWYHFSCHPVCFTDDQAGPDWPGLVATRCREKYKISPSYLQGHCGDVNPGDGTIWIGKAEPTADAVFAALGRAMDALAPVKVDAFRAVATDFAMPLDTALFQQWLTEYRNDPAKCTSGVWVDAGFAKAWYEDALKSDTTRTHLPVALGAMRLGSLGLVFHPAELFSAYGLTVRRDSPFADTLVIGYANDCIGYAPDPNSYKAGEYAAIVVPKILELPPFTPTAARALSAGMVEMLKQVAG